ncbi:hypothetical protein L210DRAFT_2671456 [Boletus edulis BED1]|uniref:Uncharacterized protein n=1 Tax=Boletus edulis BED1 TaxID=1328754 RepID=A0AAD4BLV1_BOLED|nr:hypothetical protein L210DRAFT_2671456 [Boletus edulis BED1]
MHFPRPIICHLSPYLACSRRTHLLCVPMEARSRSGIPATSPSSPPLPLPPGADSLTMQTCAHRCARTHSLALPSPTRSQARFPSLTVLPPTLSQHDRPTTSDEAVHPLRQLHHHLPWLSLYPS